MNEAACERLGLSQQLRNMIIDERDDGTLIALAGYGEMIIRVPGKSAYVLDLRTTAALYTFFQGDNTQRLIPAIIRASLLSKGGKVAELVEWIDAHTDAPAGAGRVNARLLFRCHLCHPTTC